MSKRKILFIAVILAVTILILQLSGLIISKFQKETNQVDKDGVYVNKIVDPSKPVATPKVNAREAAVIDQESGRIIYAKNPNQEVAMASTTKIMTAIIAIERSKLTDNVVISKNAASTWGSDINLKEGEVLTMRDLLYGLLLKSGNDAAVAIAEHVGGSVDGFSDLMNRKAASLGAHNTHFTSPHGLDAKGHYSTAMDLAIMTRYALGLEIFAKIVSTRTMGIKGRTLNNTNQLLSYYQGADGVKTGYTGDAGRCLVASATRDGRQYIAVTLGAPTNSARAQTCANLLEYAFANYKTYPLFAKGEAVISLDVLKGKVTKVPIIALNGGISVPVADGESVMLETSLNVPERIDAPVLKDIEIGSLEVIIGGKQVSSFKLKTGQDSKRKEIKDFIADMFGGWLKIAS